MNLMHKSMQMKSPFGIHSAPPSPQSTHSTIAHVQRLVWSAPTSPMIRSKQSSQDESLNPPSYYSSVNTTSRSHNLSIDSVGSQESVVASSLAMSNINSQSDGYSDIISRASVARKSRKRKGYRNKLATQRNALKRLRTDEEYRSSENATRSIRLKNERKDPHTRTLENFERRMRHHEERKKDQFKLNENLSRRAGHHEERKDDQFKLNENLSRKARHHEERKDDQFKLNENLSRRARHHEERKDDQFKLNENLSRRSRHHEERKDNQFKLNENLARKDKLQRQREDSKLNPDIVYTNYLHQITLGPTCVCSFCGNLYFRKQFLP